MTKILVVEDDRNIVSYVSTILLGAGYTCVAAPDAQGAVAMLDSEPDIALLILDQNLGEETESGLALLTKLRSTARFRSLPVVVCSGDTRGMIVGGFLGQRIAGFVKKPFRPERLLADVQRALGDGGLVTP